MTDPNKLPLKGSFHPVENAFIPAHCHDSGSALLLTHGIEVELRTLHAVGDDLAESFETTTASPLAVQGLERAVRQFGRQARRPDRRDPVARARSCPPFNSTCSGRRWRAQ